MSPFFNLREKDTFSGLNQYSARGQDVLVANVFRQDALSLFLPSSNPLALGYTAEFLILASLDHGEQHFDKNGFLVRPAPVGGPIVEHDINSFYLGWTGDGHIGWLNVTHAFYQALGHDDKNPIAGHSVNINAQMAALELSVDRDYLRPKFSLFYASGDGNPRDKWATGFDSILDNPTFIGSPLFVLRPAGFRPGRIERPGQARRLVVARSAHQQNRGTGQLRESRHVHRRAGTGRRHHAQAQAAVQCELHPLRGHRAHPRNPPH